jgi:predicted pyridoxine 5'-phosphate oxidase superfamily flavin-nucleotide-binding protein
MSSTDRQFVSDIAFTADVKQEQERRGSRDGYAKMEQRGGWRSKVDEQLTAFLAARDSFYLATVSSDGHPYIQHRGGPKGFLKVVDDSTLGFADFAGNRQYISLGNSGGNDRANIFLMDYAHRARVKVWGRLRFVEDDPDLLRSLAMPGYKAKVERAALFTIEAWDTNCPQHITPRFTEEELAPTLFRYEQRIAELSAEVERLKGQLQQNQPGDDRFGL